MKMKIPPKYVLNDQKEEKLIKIEYYPGTDISDAVEHAIGVCIENRTNVYFRFNGVDIFFNYDKIVKNLISNTVDDYSRRLMQNRHEGVKHD